MTAPWWAPQAPWLVALLDAGAKARTRRARWLARLEADPAFRRRQRVRLERKATEHPKNALLTRQLADVRAASKPPSTHLLSTRKDHRP